MTKIPGWFLSAKEIMYLHNDEVLEYIVSRCGKLPELPKPHNGDFSVFYLTLAVELWARENGEDALSSYGLLRTQEIRESKP